ncbi:NAD(+) synthase [Pseudoflavonifractor phocaeensis]|uniref:NAD(+) synthase n=1 Tax=Pseudoflavonifractor phocaeensis TaxID=1870988 RepID=UPI001F25132A|nr:NAD(+) synthase [Pseudoflavonifractor phocaeensis]MCF2595473.1 NAD(+) synthase [Pseudoflavonifractor phocaeensis]
MRDGFIKIAAGTPEVRVADCAYNADRCIELIRQGAEQGVKVLCLPELCLTGYTCGDLFLQEPLLRGAEAALKRVLAETADVDMLIALGLPVRYNHKLFNCAAVLCRGKLLGLVPKQNIPNYTEFYEARWFASGRELGEGLAIPFAGQEAVDFSTGLIFRCADFPLLTVGVEICEDLWVADTPSTRLAQGGATLILNPSASDETVCKDEYRRTLLAATSGRLVCGYVYADAGWGESSTDLIYAGHSIIAENGSILAQRRFETGLTVTELDLEKLAHERQRMSTFPAAAPDVYPRCFSLEVGDTALTRPIPKNPFVPADRGDRAARCQEILTLAALGLKKRLAHTHAKTAVVGLSGGLDSTLALLITARAMAMLDRPASDIVAITMPCFGTTSRTKSNAELLAERVGAALKIIDIGEAVKVHFRDIGQSMEDLSVTFENGQARERTQVLMDIANQSGGLVIGTGDLSELALGWATYNGDHMSMYAVNAGIPKTLVRHLVAYVADENQDRDPQLSAVLRDILDTPVSPELLPPKEGEIAQRTEDLVGPYELHDFFLYYAVRWGFSPRKVYRLALYALEDAYGRETILKWLNNFYRRFFAQQFKRSCLPDGPKVGSVTLSPRGDWRMPSDAVAALWMEELTGLE